jgi:hypothetical protein
MSTADPDRRRILLSAFRMPQAQTIVGRKSSITNAFVNAIIPIIQPTVEEIEQALSVLGIDPLDMRCIYCGNAYTEWDHLRPLVINQRPTGFISEIANLVPSCGKCNQSKGNSEWRVWICGAAKYSPGGRRIDVTDRVRRLEAYEQWRSPTQIDFPTVLGEELWTKYWNWHAQIIAEMRLCQNFATTLSTQIAEHLRKP